MRGLSIILLALVVGCTGIRKQRQVVAVEAPLYAFDLTSEVAGLQQSVSFNTEGASFGMENTPSYLILDSLPTVQRDFNLSFWFRSTSEKGDYTQTYLRAYNSEDRRVNINLGIGGFRLTGNLNSNTFSAKNFAQGNAASRQYYDLPRLEVGKFYFVSVNKAGGTIEIYVNAERYQDFDFSSDTNLQFDRILLGALNTSGDYVNQFTGNIRNLQVFAKTLSADEIYSLSVKTYPEIKTFNDAFELSKFNLDN